MKNLIEDWKQNAERKSNENYDFLMWLKLHQNSDKIDEVSFETHTEVFSKIKLVIARTKYDNLIN